QEAPPPPQDTGCDELLYGDLCPPSVDRSGDDGDGSALFGGGSGGGGGASGSFGGGGGSFGGGGAGGTWSDPVTSTPGSGQEIVVIGVRPPTVGVLSSPNTVYF